MDFEQLAFIEKWRPRAARGTVVALDMTRDHVLITVRAGELGPRLDLRGRDETGAVRKQRLTLGDRIFAAFRYRAVDVVPATQATSDLVITKGAEVEGTLTATGELAEVEVNGIMLILEGDVLAPFAVGDAIRFRVADEGRAYIIPTR